LVEKKSGVGWLETLVGGDGVDPLDTYPAMESCEDGEVALIH
jgi:hypothetical protein